jgi:lipoprotein-anchoring transpeptidase ErfK/SrfK
LRSRTFIAVALLCTLLIAGAVGLYLYDSSRDDLIAKGVTVGGVEVGGMRAEAARAKLRRELLDPLDRTLTVAVGERRYHLSAREAHIRADIGGMVDSALGASRDGWIGSRAWRDLTGGRENADLPADVSYSDVAVRRLVDRVRVSVTRPAVDALVSFNKRGPKIRPGQDGIALDSAALRKRVEATILRPGADTVTATASVVHPAVTTQSLAKRYPYVIIVNRKDFRLKLFHDLHLQKTYKIAVGRVGLETPAGLYHIQNKAENPAWHVPKSPWAGKLAGKVIPAGDPDNPIKARWMGIFDGAGIHGTDALSSLGTAASHGCVRMAIPDVIELYDEVPVGAPVYIA